MGYVRICSVLVCVHTPYHRHSGTVSTAVSIITHTQHKAGTCTHTHTHTHTVLNVHCGTNYQLTKPLVTVTAQHLAVVLPYTEVCLHVTLCCCASSSQHYEGTKTLWNANIASQSIVSADSHLLEYDNLIQTVAPDIPSCGSCWPLKEAGATVLQNVGNHWTNNRVIYFRITWISDLWLDFSI
jgi:hypothetical protein